MAFNSAPDYANALWMLDELCLPACSVFGPFAYFSPQFDALAVQSSVGRSNYNALQVSVRKRWGHGYQFDVNYTLSKSKDLGSSVERGNTWFPQGLGGDSGILMNPWQPDRQWGPSDFDVRHQLNVNCGGQPSVWEGPEVGRRQLELRQRDRRRLERGRPAAGDERLPVQRVELFPLLGHNWILQGNAELVEPGMLPQTAVTHADGSPNAFAVSEDCPGVLSTRPSGRGRDPQPVAGRRLLHIDLSVSKAWKMPHGSLRFRWDTFNLTNAVNFDTATVTMYRDKSETFGRYNGTLATCDGRAGRCMQFALHYEF